MTRMSRIDTTTQLWDVTGFLWAEAEMLDRRDYDAWLALWLPEGHYTMPIGDTQDFDNALNLCHDNDRMRRDRIGRFQQGFSISSAPPAETVRQVSRVVIEAEGARVTARSALHLVETKFGRQRAWAGNVTHVLDRDGAVEGDGWRIRAKVIRLLNSDGMLNSFSYLF